MPALSSSMQAALESSDFRVRQIVPGKKTRRIAGNRFETDLSSSQSLRELHALLASDADGAPVGGLINLLCLTEQFKVEGPGSAANASELASSLFLVLKEFESDLRSSAEQGGGWVYNFTSFDGKFGLGSHTGLPVAQASSLGLMKTIAREWPGICAKTIDLAPDLDPQILFTHVAQEILAGDSAIEIGITAAGRCRLDIVPGNDPHVSEPLVLEKGAVVLVTGGAYGVTAAVTKLLAAESNPHLVLVGRSPLPPVEDDATRLITETSALRRHLIKTMSAADPAVKPADIERQLKRMHKDREIRANLDYFSKMCAGVEYHALDVRDANAFGSLIDDMYARLGRIDGVIHGAGIVEDRLIKDKTVESFARVFDTKVHSAVLLTEKIKPEGLKFLALFSSVSGRFGNAGQCDYSAANEYLNKLAAHLDRRWPGRVVAFNWGPWDGGMVSDELRRLYDKHDIGMIPQEEGARMFLSELGLNGDGVPEVILACDVRRIEAGGKLTD